MKGSSSHQLALAAEAKPSLLDFGVIEEGIARNFSDTRGRAFARYVCREYFHIADDDVPSTLVDNGNDAGIDIIHIDRDTRTINICSCKCVTTFRKAATNFPGAEIDKIICFLDDLLYRREALLYRVHQELGMHIRVIWEVLEESSYEICVHLFSNQLPLAKLERERMLESLSRHQRVRLCEHGLYELAHGAVRAAKPLFRKKLTPIHGATLEVNDCNSRGLQTRISLEELVRFLSFDKKLSEFDDRLLDHNVRYYLGRENPANSQIRQTLIDGNKADFWYLNNGIVICCDQILGVTNGCHPLQLVNPQIVNGGQTARVVHDEYSLLVKNDEAGSVLVKIVETKDKEFIERIAIASNTQSRILSRDLRAIDVIQKKIAISVSRLGYFYMRKRGEKVAEAVNGVIDSLRAGQLLLAYVARDPVRSKTNSNEIFGDLYDVAFNPEVITGEIIVAAHRVHQTIERKRLDALQLVKAGDRRSYGETWIIEGHYHVVFVVGELMRLNKFDISDSDRAVSLVPEAIQIVAEFVSANRNVSAYRLFRSAQSRRDIRKIIQAESEFNDDTGSQLRLAI